MKIHKEGYKIIARSSIIFALIITAALFTLSHLATIIICGALLLQWLFIVRFFRQPKRVAPQQDNSIIYAPADGEVVAIEVVYEDEFFKDERIQVSIFMSVWNVHMNWYPIAGEIEYHKHHHGKFLVAWHPKSSTENERTTTVINTGKHQILFRQIAGFVARRIVSYAPSKTKILQNENCGFIKFGSRVDMFLPLGTHVNVKVGDYTTGTKTIVANLPKCN